ncbi:MAG TPA: ABC transporter permease [Blastocatellia bacterium]|jgi:putative ABC transport system permease protein|nr:ABC transporter permease [Blastocatellia bacterium]
MQTLWQDLRYGFRTLMRKPGFTVVAIIALALGIGANTAIFSVINSVLLRPLAYQEPERLVVINHDYPKISLKASVSAIGYTHYRDNAKSFESVTATTGGSFNLTGGGDPEQVNGAMVTHNFFSALGARPALGRLFLPEEDQPGKNKVVVFSNGFWQRRFGGDPGVVNKTVTLNDESYTVVGVMPPSFQFGREIGRIVDLWTPIAFTPQQLSYNNLTNEFLFVFARLKPGVTIGQAQAEMDAIAANLRRQYLPWAGSRSEWGLTMQSFNELVVGEIRLALWILMGIVGLVLLIACANVANLLLARAADRQKEMAIRTALGAGRWRVIRQLLTESALLAVIGGALGLLLAWLGINALLKVNQVQIPRANEIGLDWRVLAFTLGVSLLTGVAFGLVPALQASKADLHETLKEGGRTGSSGARAWVRNSLVVAEMALALVVLVSAGLLIRSFWRVQQVSPGFAPQNVLAMSLALPATKYREPAQRANFYKEALQRIRALPGVQSAGATSILPLSGNNSSGSFQIEGRVTPQGQSSPHGDRWAVTTDYFSTMKIPIFRGRFFDDHDTMESQPVAIIDDAMARKYWPDEDPVGKRITFQGGPNNPIWREIVGIVGHVKHSGLEGESRVQYYIPHSQTQNAFMTLVLRTSNDPASLAGAARGAIRGLDKDLPVFRVKTMEQFVSDSMAQRRFAMTLIGVFAAVAMALASVGLYGVLSYSITQRSHEIGIRMALGARAADVLRLVVGQGMLLALAGVALGGVAAFLLTRLMANLLFGVTASDPLTFATIALLLTMVALVACLAPALRATRVDPIVALRYE